MLPSTNFPIEHEDKFVVLEKLTNGFEKLFIAKSQKSDSAILSQTVILAYEHLMFKYKHFQRDEIPEIFNCILNGEVEIKYVNYVEFMQWCREYCKIRGMKNNQYIDKSKLESVADIYNRQAERRKFAVQSGCFDEYDNDSNDRLLLSFDEAVKVGAISKEFNNRLSEFNEKTERHNNVGGRKKY